MSIPSTESWGKSVQKFNKVANCAILLFFTDDQPTVKLLDYSENATYLVESRITGQKNILRVCRPDYHKKSQIESELAWMRAIDQQSPIEVPVPVSGTNGEYVQSVKLENDPREYHCTMFTFLEGQAPDENNEQELIHQFEILGEITAHLHNHSQNWQEAQTLDREPWDYETILGENPKWGRWQDGVAITPERKKLFQEVSEVIKRRLEKFGKGPDRFGLIHADLRLANLLVEDNKIKVIDFDDCGFGWYLFDLGAALSFIEHKPYVPELVKAWVKGYRKVRPLSEEEEQEIPTFIMLRRLMLISWIGSRDNETAREMGSGYTEATDALAKDYLAKFR
ncbi:Ser/Thr protein kinase RdoA (MazF antagonist) [Caldalkalibacillus uzonensis]|uniref:Ser/Thr protein kinase RdoA (MazF antagonist) n=1 Tax=Caldalkalibacillus uzonensis TaxID=353224 RepID=A0ABU0CQQ7_9BACI|nr:MULTISPECIES: phosphotransferase [Caldalkalibacillus]MDQ0338741.1 Ser/Thr protein kinase RdoA (MazF antagonist) [Caldalkalibacillus uzonensis]GGK29793.1 aminoglycoside phosphotransferase [Caldalkalibacillus thermarum]